jgi:hypothetical protein
VLGRRCMGFVVVQLMVPGVMHDGLWWFSFLHLPSIGEGAVALFEGGHLLALCKS